MNTLTSLVGVLLGLYGLFANTGSSSLYRSFCSVLILTGLGSAFHHWLPYEDWTHAADIAGFLVLMCVALSHVTSVLVNWLIPATCHRARHVSDSLVTAGLWTLSMLSMMGYAILGSFWLLEAWFFPVGIVAATITCHPLLFFVVLCRRKHHHVTKDVRRVVQGYVAILILLAIGIPAQLIEYPGPCPKWLYENGLSTHGVWHVAVFLVAYNAATILHYLETPNAVWVCPSRRVPLLLFRVTVAHEEVEADVEAQKDKVPLFDDIDLVSPPRADSRVHRRSRSEPPVIELAAAVRLRDSPSGSPERSRPSLDVV